MLGNLAAAVLACASPEGEQIPVAEVLEVEAGATCLESEVLASHLVMWLERDAIEAGIRVSVTGDPDDAHAASFVIARDGNVAAPRRLEGIPDDCSSLHAAVALAVAVAIDASIGQTFAEPEPEPEPESEPEPEPEPGPEPGPELEPELEPEPPPPARIHIVSRFSGAFALGLTDGPAYGGTAGVTLRLPKRIDVDIGAGGLVGPHGALGDGRVRTVVVQGIASVCARLDAGPTRVRSCGRFAAGAQDVEGREFAQTRSTTLPWLALGPGVDLAVPRASLVAFVAGIDLWIPLLRTRVVGLGDDGEVLEAKTVPLLGANATAGVVFRLR